MPTHQAPEPPGNPFLKPLSPKAFESLLAEKEETATSPAELKEQLSAVLDAWLYRPDFGISLTTLDRVIAWFQQHAPGCVVMGQINTTPGDLAGNAQKMIRALRLAEVIGADLIAFPELALMGYPIYDFITRFPDCVDQNLRWLDALAQRSQHTRALIGFVEHNSDVGKPFFNSAALIGDGQILQIVRKHLMPSYGEFNDDRTFEAGSEVAIAEIHGHRYGLSICEDTWNDSQFFEKPRYHHDPILCLAEHKPDCLVNISASPSRFLKAQMKQNLLSHLAKRHQLPYVYVNQVGSVDELSFDGGSCLVDAAGHFVTSAQRFSEAFTCVFPFAVDPNGQSAQLNDSATPFSYQRPSFDPSHAEDLPRTYQSICQGIHDYFQKSGFTTAILGLSGGLDSSVTAVLLADALGPEHVIGVSLPSTLTPDENKDDAKTLAQNLGITFIELPIVDQLMAAEQTAQAALKKLPKAYRAVDNSTGPDNTQAILRAATLRRIANDLPGCLPIATSDKSELYVGYATINGDMSGALAPIGDVLKTKVRALAFWLNTHRVCKNVIPETVITKPSGADLRRHPKTQALVTAEEDLMPYAFLDEVITREEFWHHSFGQMMRETFWYEQQTSITPEQKRAWLEKFYRRRQAAVFKWQVAPPILVTDGYGITAAEYNQPIVTRYEPKGYTPTEMADILDQMPDRHSSFRCHDR